MADDPIDFESARQRLRNRRGRGRGFFTRVDDSGALVFEIRGPNGTTREEWEVKREDVRRYCQWILSRLSKIERAEYAATHMRVPKSMTRSWKHCRLRRSGYIGRNGCRKKRGHEGQCIDADGPFTPPPCTHEQTTSLWLPQSGVEVDVHELRCRRCGVKLSAERKPAK